METAILVGTLRKIQYPQMCQKPQNHCSAAVLERLANKSIVRGLPQAPR